MYLINNVCWITLQPIKYTFFSNTVFTSKRRTSKFPTFLMNSSFPIVTNTHDVNRNTRYFFRLPPTVSFCIIINTVRFSCLFDPSMQNVVIKIAIIYFSHLFPVFPPNTKHRLWVTIYTQHLNPWTGRTFK